MKRILLLLPLLLIPACASKKPVIVSMPHAVPGTVLPSEDMESVRYGENLKAYPVGRYVDPNNSLVMHEGHTVYRVETTAKWNLHPNGPANVPLGPAVGIVDPAHKDGPLTPEIAAEIERQKAATQALLQQGSRLNQTLGQLSQSVVATKQISDDNARLKSALSLTEQRLETLEEQFRQKQTETTFTTPSTPQSQGTNDW